jgi:hypothetical protein
MMTFSSRDYQHFQKAGISLGVDVKDGIARVALAATNHPGGDTFSRAASRRILDLRFDANGETLNALHLKRCSYTLPYDGTTPRNDILRPLVREISDCLEARANNHTWKGRVRDILAIIRAHAKQRWKYSKAPDGKLPGVGLDETGSPVPAVCQ